MWASGSTRPDQGYGGPGRQGILLGVPVHAQTATGRVQVCNSFSASSRDRVNCLLSFIYALVRHDCLAALTTAGLDPYVGWLHATRAGRPACALDLMEEFRPCLAERLALTLINRRQIEPKHFREREGGAVEFTDPGRREVIQAWQRRKQAEVNHALFKENVRLGQVFSIQARLLARMLRGDVPDYIPYIPK